MAKFNVTFNYRSSITVTVEADTDSEALVLAEDLICDEKYDAEILNNLEEIGDCPDIEEVDD